MSDLVLVPTEAGLSVEEVDEMAAGVAMRARGEVEIPLASMHYPSMLQGMYLVHVGRIVALVVKQQRGSSHSDPLLLLHFPLG
jgi:hypothetical protein